MKPKHQGGYTAEHAHLCERTLVTLLRGLGQWRASIYLVGGLVPRYLIQSPGGTEAQPPHAGTTDVDIFLDLSVLATMEAYRTLEDRLKDLGFIRGTNDAGNVQQHSWRKRVTNAITVIVDLLCDPESEENARLVKLPGEAGLKALRIPGAHLVAADYVEIPLTAELLDDRGVVTETIRIANIVPFVVLKALAFEDRLEEKDAYDLVYCLRYYHDGPASVAIAFEAAMRKLPDEPLITRAVGILREHFATDERTQGIRKDGPAHYARFSTDPGQPDLDARNRRDAAETVEAFLIHLDRLLAV
jgi:hypothetical protein